MTPETMTLRALLEQRLESALDAVGCLRSRLDAIAQIATTLGDVLDAGGTLYTAGNGGSAAQALHLAEELIGRYRGDRPARSAVCLCADSTALTCIANDYGFEAIFARQCEALLRPIDVLLVLSTSGRSANLVAALEVARARGTRTIGLLGNDGGRCAGLCDLAVTIPGTDSAHTQETHQVIIHMLCEAFEAAG